MSLVASRAYFWDGDNFVIVTKNCSKEMAKKMLQAIATQDIEDVRVPDAELVPMAEEEEKMPDIRDNVDWAPLEAPEEPKFPENQKYYPGKTPAEVLQENGDKGFGNLTFLKKKFQDMPDLIQEIESAQRLFVKKTFENVNPDALALGMSENECRTFLQRYWGIFTPEVEKSLLSQAGALDMKTFISEASLDKLRAVIVAMVNKYA